LDYWSDSVNPGTYLNWNGFIAQCAFMQSYFDIKQSNLI